MKKRKKRRKKIFAPSKQQTQERKKQKYQHPNKITANTRKTKTKFYDFIMKQFVFCVKFQKPSSHCELK